MGPEQRTPTPETLGHRERILHNDGSYFNRVAEKSVIVAYPMVSGRPERGLFGRKKLRRQ